MSNILSTAGPDEYGGTWNNPSHGGSHGWASTERWACPGVPIDQPYPTTDTPDQIVLDDGSVVCAIWCATGNGHPFATDPSDRTCRSEQIRFEPAAGGGRSSHIRPAAKRNGRDTPVECPAIPIADAAVSISAEQYPGEPPTVVLATEVAAVEQHITLTIDETDRLATDMFLLGMRIEGQRD